MNFVANLSVRPSAQRGNITYLADAVVDLEIAHGRLRLYGGAYVASALQGDTGPGAGGCFFRPEHLS